MSEYEKETKAFIKAIFSARKDEDDSPIKLILANADAKEHFKNSLPDFEGIGVELFVKKEFASIYQKDNSLMRFDKSIVMSTSDDKVYGGSIEFKYKNISVIVKLNNFESREEALVVVDELDSLHINFKEKGLSFYRADGTAIFLEVELRKSVFIINSKEVNFTSAHKYVLDNMQAGVVSFKKNIYCVRKLFCVIDLFKDIG